MNRELPFLGETSPPRRVHEDADVMACTTIGSAIERAMVSAHMTHESLSERMGVSRGYLSLIISGKRNANVLHVLRAVRATGSLAPIQWVCKQVGGELYCDPVEQKRAELKAQLAALDERVA